MSLFENGNKINFSLYSAIEGQVNFSGTVEGKVKASLVVLQPGNGIVENHANIWPTIPSEIREVYNDLYTAYDYIALKQADGQMHYIGLPWIREQTLVVENLKKLTLTIGNYPDTDAVNITRILESYGYTVEESKIIE